VDRIESEPAMSREPGLTPAIVQVTDEPKVLEKEAVIVPEVTRNN
jgi:hypothetical protein